MQIEGLSQPTDYQKHHFSPVRALFNHQGNLHFLGQGPNANIRAFLYMLLAHIRREHFKKLLRKIKQEELRFMEEEHPMKRERKVSFNGKGAIFDHGTEHDNYPLHKLKIFAFSKEVDLSEIVGSPF